MKTKTLTLVLSVLALSGCFRVKYEEEEKVLSVADLSSLTLGAEVLGEGNVYEPAVEAPVTVKANRSWSAVIEYEGSETGWLDLSADERLNLHKYTVGDTLSVIAARNKSEVSRKARIVISEDAQTVFTLPVEQTGQVRFLAATPLREKALAILDTVKVSVACNTVWKAQVDPSSTAEVTLENAEGEDYGTLKVCFGENDDADHEMEAVVTLSAEGCDPCTVRIAQSKGVPYVAFRMDGNTVIPTEAETFTIRCAANTHWYMAISESDKFPGAALSQTEGDATTGGEVVLSYIHGTDPEVKEKRITLKMWADGIEPVYLTLTQKGCLHLDFMDWDMSWNSPDHPKWWFTPKWPFASPEYKSFPQGSGASLKDGIYEFVTPEGYVFKIKTAGSPGIWFHLHQMGFIVGTDKNDTYVEFPAIEGMKLTTVIYEPPYTGNSTTANIRDVDGNAVKGSITVHNYEKNTVTTSNTTQWKAADCTGNNKVTMETSYTCTFNLSETEPGAVYRHTLVYAGSLTIKEYTLIYE